MNTFSRAESQIRLKPHTKGKRESRIQIMALSFRFLEIIREILNCWKPLLLVSILFLGCKQTNEPSIEEQDEIRTLAGKEGRYWLESSMRTYGYFFRPDGKMVRFELHNGCIELVGYDGIKGSEVINWRMENNMLVDTVEAYRLLEMEILSLATDSLVVNNMRVSSAKLKYLPLETHWCNTEFDIDDFIDNYNPNEGTIEGIEPVYVD